MKLLIFDLMGVVFPNIHEGSGKNIQRLYDLTTNPPVSFEDFYLRYKSCNTGKISHTQLWEGFTDNIKEVEEEFLNYYEIYPNLLEIITKLKEEYQVIALTNHVSEWINYLNAKFKLDLLFEKIYISADLGFSKPDIRAYEKVIGDYQVKNTEVYLIDDQNKNLVTAQEIGIHTIKYLSKPDKIAFVAEYLLDDLKELPELLSKKQD